MKIFMILVWLFVFEPVLNIDLSEAEHEDSTRMQHDVSEC